MPPVITYICKIITIANEYFRDKLGAKTKTLFIIDVIVV